MCPNGLSDAVEVSFGCRIGNMRALEGGEESEIFLVDTEVEERVLRLGPGWRSSAELGWSYAVASYAAAKMDEVGAPILRGTESSLSDTRTGQYRFGHISRVALWGKKTKPSETSLASILARLRRVLSSWLDRRERPPPIPKRW